MPGKLRVAIVAPSLRILGGQAVQADRLLRSWRHDPDVEAWLVPHNPLPPRFMRRALEIKYLRTIVTEGTYGPLLVRELARADVIHVFSASYSSFLLAPLPAILIANMLGRPVVLNYRSGEAPDHLARSAIARAALRRVARIVVPSAFLVQVMARFGLTATVVPNVVDLDRFGFSLRDPLRPRLVSTRNFEPLYNVACTLRAFRIVQDRVPDATLTLVGGGSEEVRLRALARELDLTNVTFVGRVPPDEIAAHYASGDIYVQTPNVDNMPTSVLEAYASGLPVVSTEAGGVPVIVTHGQNGLLAPLDDHAAVAAHVLRLLGDPARARRLVMSARLGCNDYTWTAVRSQWIRVYRGALGPSARSTAHQRSAAMLGERLQ
jgi:glycosyltransferase involved in cell wall biosynthesis